LQAWLARAGRRSSLAVKWSAAKRGRGRGKLGAPVVLGSACLTNVIARRARLY